MSSVVSRSSNNSAGGLMGGVPDDEMVGWVYKWTNYLKGYQKRWLVLQKGTLSYYRNQAEVGHTCRGAINLPGAYIHREDGLNFMVSGGTQTFHLKAANEVERQRWLTALELSRLRAIKNAESDEEEDMKMEMEEQEAERGELWSSLRAMQNKMQDLNTCQDLIVKHGSALLRALGDMETVKENEPESRKTLGERTTLFRITSSAMVNACGEFSNMAQTYGRKWHRLLQHEHQQRVQLQEQLEQLARQHSHLEKAANAISHNGTTTKHRQPIDIYSSESEEEEEFQDAQEDTVSILKEKKSVAKKASLARSGSEVSAGQEEEPLAAQKQAKDKMFHVKFVTRRSSTGESPERSGHRTPSPIRPSRQRRPAIPNRPNIGMSLWSIMKNSIGKELSKIPMPVNFNEPLSMLQRLTEDLEYAHVLLDRAATMTDPFEELCYVAAFTVSSYGSLTHRTGKPFNPLLGETYECDRTDDFGWKAITEQVSHHPPAAAQFAEGPGWTLWQEFTMSSKFRGKYLSVIPLGIAHLEFHKSGNLYTWRKVTTTVHNIIVGKLWIDNHGDMTIENHKTGDKCHLKYLPYSYFSRETPRKVTGVATDRNGTVRWVVQGTWDDSMESAKVLREQADPRNPEKPIYETSPPKVIWKKKPALAGAENFYHFTKLAIELNESEEGVAPTDSRHRPDQRQMEVGAWDRANEEKVRLEEKQRAARRARETDAEKAMLEGRPFRDYEPTWFVKQKDKWTGQVIHSYNGQYWKCKEKQEWARCPDIY